jgi:hypothetical protein
VSGATEIKSLQAQRSFVERRPSTLKKFLKHGIMNYFLMLRAREIGSLLTCS